MLWGSSGNRCAVCRRRLVADQTALDRGSVIGDECHIISGSENGPRHDPNWPPNMVDDICNLLLLCGSDHKMVDDQVRQYTVEALRTLKSAHEKWVDTTLSQAPAATTDPYQENWRQSFERMRNRVLYANLTNDIPGELHLLRMLLVENGIADNPWVAEFFYQWLNKFVVQQNLSVPNAFSADEIDALRRELRQLSPPVVKRQ